MFGLPPWTGDLWILRCQTCRRKHCPCEWVPRTHRPPWPEGFPQLSFLSWGWSSSSQSSDPWIRWLTRILRGFEPQLLGRWVMVGQRPSGKLRSWPRFLPPRISWLNRLSSCLCSSVASCGNFQISTKHKEGVFWYLLSSLVLSPFWIVWRWIWMSNGSDCGVKPGDPYRPTPKGPQLTTDLPCPPSWYHILLYNCLLPTS